MLSLANLLVFLSPQGFGLEDSQSSFQVPDSSLLRELFEAPDETTATASVPTAEPEYSMFAKPQLSTVNIGYISRSQEYAMTPLTPAISKHSEFIALLPSNLNTPGGLSLA